MFKIAARKSRGMQRTYSYVKFRGMQRNKDIGLFAKPSNKKSPGVLPSRGFQFNKNAPGGLKMSTRGLNFGFGLYRRMDASKAKKEASAKKLAFDVSVIRHCV